MRHLGTIVILLAVLTGCSGGNKPYPNQAITVICPWSAGGGTDRLSRFIADELQTRLGQPTVVANKTGGSGAIGFAAGANAPADGYTITMATFELNTMHWLGISKLTYQSFTPLMQLNGDAAALIVRKDSPFRNLDDLVAAIRKKPGSLQMSGTAKGAAWDLARSGFLMAAGLPVDSVVWVPTKGAAPAIVELLGDHIQAICCSVPEALPQIESGELRVLAVMAPERLPEFPNIPTCKELGVDWEAVGWRGLALPRGTPEPIVQKLTDTCLEIARSDPFKSFMKKNGFALVVRGPAEFAKFLQAQDEQWHKVILGSNIGADSLQGPGGTGARNPDPGPWALPVAALLFIIVLSAAQRLRPKGTAEMAPSSSDFSAGASLRPAVVLVGGLAAYLLMMPWLGFFTMTALLAAGIMRWLGRSWGTSLISAVLLMTIIYGLFVRLFKVPLPKGLIF